MEVTLIYDFNASPQLVRYNEGLLHLLSIGS